MPFLSGKQTNKYRKLAPRETGKATEHRQRTDETFRSRLARFIINIECHLAFHFIVLDRHISVRFQLTKNASRTSLLARPRGLESSCQVPWYRSAPRNASLHRVSSCLIRSARLQWAYRYCTSLPSLSSLPAEHVVQVLRR